MFRQTSLSLVNIYNLTVKMEMEKNLLRIQDMVSNIANTQIPCPHISRRPPFLETIKAAWVALVFIASSQDLRPFGAKDWADLPCHAPVSKN